MSALALVVTSLVQASTADCASIRRTLELARAEGLDATAVSRLELKYCTTTQSDVCTDVSSLWLMSMVVGSANETAALDGQRTVLCSIPQDAEALLLWPDRSSLRSRAGTWSWDSGAMAKTSGQKATWYWPSGALARTPSGTLFYPDGSMARAGTGVWYLPGGALVQTESALAAAACKVSPDVCRAWLAYLPVTQGAARDVALVGLGWSARR
jgi:DNA-binding transcriptional LysR family regulator